jgi:3-dehydroquinate synthetase
VPFSKLFDVIKRDKKRVDDQVVFVLLERIGKTVIRSGFEESLLSEVWDQALSQTTA